MSGGRQNCIMKAKFLGTQSKSWWCHYSIAITVHCAVNVYFITICSNLSIASLNKLESIPWPWHNLRGAQNLPCQFQISGIQFLIKLQRPELWMADSQFTLIDGAGGRICNLGRVLASETSCCTVWLEWRPACLKLSLYIYLMIIIYPLCNQVKVIRNSDDLSQFLN